MEIAEGAPKTEDPWGAESVSVEKRKAASLFFFFPPFGKNQTLGRAASVVTPRFAAPPVRMWTIFSPPLMFSPGACVHLPEDFHPAIVGAEEIAANFHLGSFRDGTPPTKRGPFPSVWSLILARCRK
jgi:hypothetical protein